MIKNCKIVEFQSFEDERGALVPIEYPKDLSFDINRIYYIYNVPNNLERGFHSHYDLEQVLLCVHGSVKIRISNHESEEIVELNNPSEGLYIGPMIWREMYDFTDDAVLLVLASHRFDKNDYIFDKKEYLKSAKAYFEEYKHEQMKAKSVQVSLVTENDAELILKLRNDPEQGKYLSKTVDTVEEQKEWIRKYKEREKSGLEYYFKISDNLRDIGFFRLYNVDYAKHELKFGSFVMENERPKYTAVESMILAAEYSFYGLRMNRILMDIKNKNEKAKEFYKRFGYKKIDENGIEESFELRKEEYEDNYREEYKRMLK